MMFAPETEMTEGFMRAQMNAVHQVRDRVLPRRDEVEEGSTEVASGGAEAASISTPGMDYADLAVKVGAAVAFGAFVDLQFGFEKAEAYFTGYILEQTLSVDNLFVFILLTFRAIPSLFPTRTMLILSLSLRAAEVR